MGPVRIATWNVNSVRQRASRSLWIWRKAMKTAAMAPIAATLEPQALIQSVIIGSLSAAPEIRPRALAHVHRILGGWRIAGAPTGRGGGGRLPQRPWREWTAPVFEVDADRPVPAGIDGEAAQLQPPLRFHIRPGVLRVCVARRHPGASPSAMLPEGLGQSARALARIAAGRDPVPAAVGEPVLTLPTEPTTKES